jgi:hypothetical protein
MQVCFDYILKACREDLLAVSESPPFLLRRLVIASVLGLLVIGRVGPWFGIRLRQKIWNIGRLAWGN